MGQGQSQLPEKNNRSVMMNLVPVESLSDLTCVTCKKVLSQYPIYCHSGGPTCGRCPYPPDGIRNEAYEVLAQKLKFPCSNNENGCLENLLPKDVPTHEKFCRFRKYKCPIICNPICEWEGIANDLLDHAERTHPMFLQKEGPFEIDFINSHNENYLMPYGENLFIVNRRADTRNHSFSCTVSYIGSNASVEESSYKIILESGNKTHKHEICNRINLTTQIDRDGLSAILNDPTSILARVEVFQEEKNVIDNDDDKHDSRNLNYDLLRELECMVCMEYMIPPIHQCLTGHSICKRCKESVKECPTCKNEFKDTQNFVLAQIIAHIDYPCKHSRCRFSSKAKDIKLHEANCLFAPHPCPLKDYTDCNKELKFEEFYDHILNNHYENLLELDCASLPFDFDTDDGIEDCFIIKYCSKLFKLHFWYHDNNIYFAVQLVGPDEESSNYRFEIDILDVSGKNHRAYCTRPCGPLTKSVDAFKENNEFICFTKQQIEHLITDQLCFRVIIRNN